MSTGPANHRARGSPARRRVSKWRRRCQAGALIVVAALPLVLGVTWAVYAGRGSWRDWLTRLKPASSRETSDATGFGHRATGEPGVAYHGDGRVELGDFSVKVFNPVTRVVLRTDFRLEGVTSCADQDAFEQFIQGNHRFFREQVMVSVRNSDLEELTDPKLHLLKRRIIARVNLALGEPFLISVDVKDFNLLESLDRSGFVRYDPEVTEVQ